jgi:hypothetical protein
MKKCFSLLVVLAVGMAFCLTANAYYPHLTVRACPHCTAHVAQEETVSGNTIGAKLYTDGKREAKMLPDHPWLVRCPYCSNLFWVDEAVQVSSGFEAASGEINVLAPSEKEILNFLEGPTLPKDKEIYLRMHAWWSANDAWRWVPNPKPAFSEAQIKNLEALSAILNEAEPIERILKAEIARELGHFDNSKNLLSYEFADQFNYAASIIRQMAEEGDSRVRLISPSTPETYKPRSYPSSRKSRIKTE